MPSILLYNVDFSSYVTYLVILAGWSGLNIAAGDIYLLAVIVEVHTGHSIHDGPHYPNFTSTLALLYGITEGRKVPC